MEKNISTMSRAGEIGQKLIDLIADKWILKGHPLTGAFIDSLEWEGDDQSIRIWGFPYGRYVSDGIPADRIPYTRASGRGGTSKYISGLILYGQLRLGLDEKEAKSFAFAVAEKHSQEGMPGSGFLDEVEQQAMSDIDGEVQRWVDEKITKNI